MQIVLIEKPPIPDYKNNLGEFPDNTLGIIRKWDNMPKRVGEIVLKKTNHLYRLSDVLTGEEPFWIDFSALARVKGDMIIDIIPEGSKIVITV